ncbi:MAG: amidohydrolase family protein [Anaerolineaceae bacterium]|nr:amidohydrolase family protein [Anaerolineaceae bacterium]
MTESRQIVHAGLGLVDDEFQRDVALLIEGATIVEVSGRGTLVSQHPDVPVLGSEDLLLMPGFVNSHDHGRALGTVTLGLPDDLLEVWLAGLGSLPRIPPRLAAEYEGWQLIRSGVTTVAHSHNPASLATMFEEVPQALVGYRRAGLRVAMFPPLLDQNTLVYRDSESFIASLPADLRDSARARAQRPGMGIQEWLDSLQSLYDRYHDARNHRIHIQASPVGGQWASDLLILGATDWARANNTRVQMHMLESPFQRDYAWRTWGRGFIEQLDRMSALGDWLTLAHMIWSEADDPALLAARDVSVAHNPSSNLRLRSGIAPTARYRCAGVNVGIGMDGHTLDDDQDYLREMRLAFTLGNKPGASSVGLSPGDVLKMATRSGAIATFGQNVPLGALKPGWLADLVLLDWRAIRGDALPAHFPSDNHIPEFLLRRATRRHVRHVMVHGEWTLRDGHHTRLEESGLHAAVREALECIVPSTPHLLGQHLRRFYAAWDKDRPKAV